MDRYGGTVLNTNISSHRDCNGPDAPVMNNIGYALSGYDIYYGNPVALSSSGLVDPGIRNDIFLAEYSNNQTTADNRYCTPKGMTVKSCNGNCALAFSTEIIKGTSSYFHKLEEKVSFEATYELASFGASQDYKHIEKYTRSGENMLTQSEISCCVYISKLDMYTPPKFAPNFLAGLATLTDTYQSDVYRK